MIARFLCMLSLFTAGFAAQKAAATWYNDIGDEVSEWINDILDWRHNAAEWKHQVERGCFVNESDAYWTSLFKCPDFSEIQCVNQTARNSAIDSLNCTIAFCEDGRYTNNTVLRIINRGQSDMYKKIIGIYKEDFIQCKIRSCSEATLTSNQVKEPAITSVSPTITESNNKDASSTTPAEAANTTNPMTESATTFVPQPVTESESSDAMFIADSANTTNQGTESATTFVPQPVTESESSDAMFIADSADTTNQGTESATIFVSRSVTESESSDVMSNAEDDCRNRGGLLHYGKCFTLPHLSSSYDMNYDEAVAECAKHGALLAEIHDRVQQNALYDFTITKMPTHPSFVYVWFGMEYKYSTSTLLYRSGMEKNFNQFQWVKYTPYSSSSWKYMIMTVTNYGGSLDGLWNHLKTYSAHGVMCEKET